MLTLDTIAEEAPYTRQTDEYKPLKIEFQPPLTSVDEILYWRSMNGRYLLEVGLAVATGALSTISLVLVPPAWIQQRPSIKDLCNAERRGRGLPVFHLAPWRDRIGSKETGVDPTLRISVEHIPFKFYTARDGVALLFDDFEPSSVVVNKDISFCFNARNEWCGLVSER